MSENGSFMLTKLVRACKKGENSFKQHNNIFKILTKVFF